MRRETTSRAARPVSCEQCGEALPDGDAVCPRCGANALLLALPPAELAPPPQPAVRPAAARLDAAPLTRRARLRAAMPRRLSSGDLNGARRWGMNRGAAIVLAGFAIVFGTYVALTEHEAAQVKWRYIFHPNEPLVTRHGVAAVKPKPSPVPLVALLEDEIKRLRDDSAKDDARVRDDQAKAERAREQNAAAAASNASVRAAPPRTGSLAEPAPTHAPVNEPRKTAAPAVSLPAIAKDAAPAGRQLPSPKNFAPAMRPVPNVREAAPPVQPLPSAKEAAPAMRPVPNVREAAPPVQPLPSAKEAAPPVQPVPSAKGAAPPVQPVPNVKAPELAMQPVPNAMSAVPPIRPAPNLKESASTIRRQASANEAVSAERGVRRTADVCDKRHPSACARRHGVVKAQSGERLESPDGNAVVSASDIEPKVPSPPPRGRVVREPGRPVAVPETVPVPVEAPRKVPPPEPAAVAQVPEPRSTRAPQLAASPAPVPVATPANPLQRLLESKEQRLLYRGH